MPRRQRTQEAAVPGASTSASVRERVDAHLLDRGLVVVDGVRPAFTFRDRIGAGMVSVNNSTSGAEAHLPFGGNGKSGNGSRQSGIWVLDQFTRWQSVNWDYSGRLQKAQMDVAELTPDTTFRL